MSERNKKPENSKKTEQHKKSANTSLKVKKKVSNDSQKKIHKTGIKQDDWNDPTGNTHLSDKS